MRDAGFYGAVTAIIGAGIAAMVTLFQVFKNSKDQARTTELNELREFRKELRDDIHRLEEHVNSLQTELNSAQSQITKQNGMFIGILYRLEGIIALKDAPAIISELGLLVRHVREFLDLPIGAPELAMKHIREADTDG